MRIGILVFAVSLAGAAAAGDWPQFRGPAGSGVSSDTGLPVEIDPAKNLVWKTALPPGHSSPILVGSRIFVTAYEGEALLTIALDRASGRVLWRREAPRPRKEPMQKTNSPASPSPAADGESVFVFFGDFGLLAYSVAGEERWRLPLGPFNNANGHGSSPIVTRDMVVLICDQDTGSYVIAVDKRTGKVRWKNDRPEVTRGYATPAIWRPAGGPEQVIAPGSYQLTAYDLKTGEKQWWVRGMAWQPKSVALVADGIIYVNGWESGGDVESPAPMDPWDTVRAKYDANGDGRLSPEEALPVARRGFRDDDLNGDGFLDVREWDFFVQHRTMLNSLIAIRPQTAGDLTSKVLWRYRKSLPNVPSPLIYDGVLYLVKDGGVVTALDPKTGEAHKQARVQGALEPYWSSPVASDGKVYLLSQACKLSVLKAGPQWDVLRVNQIEADSDCFATPAIADRSLYVRTRNWLYRFQEKR